MNRLTAELANAELAVKELRAELTAARFNLTARDAELDALRTAGWLTRLRIILTGTEARLARELKS